MSLAPHASILDYTALAERLAASNPAALARELHGEGQGPLAEALERSAAALACDPDQLAAHLAGRLGSRLGDDFFAGRRAPWLRPRTTSLEPPRSPLRATLAEHSAEVRAVLVMPDGRTLLSSAEDGRVLRWDLQRGELLGELEGHDDTVNAMSLSPGGDLLLTASDDHTIGLWDTATWSLRGRLEGHGDYVRRALADGAGRIVSGSDDGTLRVWDLDAQEELRVIEGHGATITAMTLLEGGRLVAAASTNNLIAVWDVETGERVRTLFDGSAGYCGEVMGLTVSAPNTGEVGHRSFPNRMWVGPDGELCSVESELIRWDPASGAQLERVSKHLWPIHDIADSREHLAFASDTLRLLDHAGEVRATLYGHEDDVTAVAFSPDGRTLVSGGKDHTLRVWDVEAALLATPTPRHIGWVGHALLSPDGRQCVTHASDGTARLWDLATGEALRAFTHEDALLAEVCFTPDGARLVVTSSSGHLWVWDVATGERVTQAQHENYWFQGIAATRDGSRLVTGGVTSPLAIWDLGSGEPGLFKGKKLHVTALALTPDDRHIVVTTYEKQGPGSLQVWDTDTRARVGQRFASKKSSFTGLELADEGRLAVTSDEERVLVISVPEAAIAYKLPTPEKPVSRMARLPDGRILAGIVVDAATLELRTIDAVAGTIEPAGRRVALDEGDRAPELRALSVSADGRRALVVADWSARVVDLETGATVARFVGDAKIVSGALQPDGRGALVGEEGGRVHALELLGD